jgi:putative copper resistance protein D
MDAMIVAARTLHYASVLLLFGGLVFALVLAPPLRGDRGGASLGGGLLPLRKACLYAVWALIGSIVSGVAWVAIEAAEMSGLPLSQALSVDNLGLVLTRTLFGEVWIGRFGLGAALGALLVLIGRSNSERVKLGLAVAATAVAGLYAATLAWSGHAAAAQASGDKIEIVSDIVHLLAAGAWLGALPGLVFVLRTEQPRQIATEAVRRFSTLGVISVGALVVSGIGNAWYLVGDVPALIGTDYGRVLLVKLGLFLAMVAFAAINRAWLAARLASAGPAGDRALRALRRNAAVELILGMMIVATVGVLGVMLPAAHQSPVWPFDRTLSWQATQQSLGGGLGAIAAAVLALIAAAATFRSVLHRRWGFGLIGIGAFAAASATWAALLAVPAYPTTYAVPPERYTAAAIRRGAHLYAQNCTICHGVLGRGDGPAAASLKVVPADLAAHGSIHRPGEIYWWIARGIPGSPMPAFAPGLTDAEIWDLVQFVSAESDAESATALTNRAQPWLNAIVAPDFSLELAGQEQDSLRRPRGNPVTLLSFYTLPESQNYLRALGDNASAFRAIGLRVITLPASKAPDVVEPELPHEWSATAARREVIDAYAMFTRPESGRSAAPLVQADFLIDRQGYIRARWIGPPASAQQRVAEVFDQAELLSRERLRPPPSAVHVH